jgi:O-antigen/teichoic acid export membrane protein
MTETPISIEFRTVAPSEETPRHAELLPRVLQGAFWMLNSNVFSRALNLARGVLLARLLVPDDFGLFGLATVVIGFTAMFSDVGAGAFLVYSQDRIEDHVDTVFWANLGIATVLASGILGTAPFVARFYHRPDLVPVLAFLALSLWLQTVTTVHRSLVRRELRFRSLALIDGLVSLAAFAIAVVLAWRGYGVWSFVLSALLGNAICVPLLFYAYAWVPRWRFVRSSVRALAPFSGWYVGQALVWYLVLNVDNLMVGKFLGIEALGIYGLAYNYALLPISFVGISLGNVIFAELPRLYADPPRFWSAYFTSSKLIAGLASPIAAALVIGAPDVFPILFGPKWASAILPFQILAIYGAIRSIWMDPFSSLGKFQHGFWMGLTTLLLNGLAIYLALPYGTIGVASAVLVAVGAAQMANLYVVSRSFAVWLHGVRNSAPYFLTAAIATFVAAGARYGFAHTVSHRKELLALVSLTTLFGIYGAVFHKQLRRYLGMMMAKQTMGLGESA